ncbi:bestrophin family ion channel [uncultured Algoriphagus sp.]|uniref:bestrophin family protein n=1 Tax=uncultured Algoriphagus sp. TaxID=417365 RepID=UPI0030EF44FA|tara:strand:+ start:48772 stop:49800 length:1029 start_codon:yes stop_codon:yes gene_type:complete
MITKKNLGLKSIYEFAGHHIIWLTGWMLIVTSLYYFTQWDFLSIPWLPLSLIGTAVAFYVGFKNNEAYDRLWEARKIWGAIVNNSRMLSTMIKNFKSSDDSTLSELELAAIKKQFVYRHIAYLYQIREQLIKPTVWEHVRLRWNFGKYNQARQNRIFSFFQNDLNEIKDLKYLSKDEIKSLESFANKATQLLDKQTEIVQQLFQVNHINLMQQMELQRAINSFYDEQGKAERIKNFPFPRHYGSFSFVFVCIFVFLLPFGIVGEMKLLGEGMIWMSIPIGVIVGWVYIVMELIGDYSENPFEGLYNDIPMLSICRMIEIDMLQMMGQTNVPNPITSKNDILM